MSAPAASAIPELRRPGALDRAMPILAAWLMALSIVAIWLVPMTASTLRDGTLFDNDDAMRLVQMREWLDGKSWFDVTEQRVNPPLGMTSHWSRVIEIPMAGAIRVLSPALGRERAEWTVVAVWPSILLATLFLGILVLAARFVSPPTLLAGGIIMALNPLLQFQFVPGRIDHHDVQMLLSLALCITTIRALADRRSGAAVAAGCVSGVMLSIGLETLPLVAAAAGFYGVAWILDAPSSRHAVRAFGASFALGTLVLFAATVEPSRWGVIAVDALSPPYVWLAFGGGGALAALASLKPPATLLRRALLALLAGAGVALAAMLVWPHILGGPFADIDPLVRRLWLDNVGEIRPLPVLVASNPRQFLYFLAFPLVGCIILGVTAARERGRRPDLLLLLAFAVASFALALGAMRGVPFASIFALVGWLIPIDRGLARLLGGEKSGAAGRPVLAAAMAIMPIVIALPVVWNALGEIIRPPPMVTTEQQSCGVQADMAALAAEPSGLVLAPLRLGPRVLVATHDDVVSVPYHRNNEGNRFALDTLTGTTGGAQPLLKARGVKYVALCLGDPDLPRLTAYRPNSFLESLIDGRAPAWLAPLPDRGPIRAWRVVG